jgi:hypothetical protein
LEWSLVPFKGADSEVMGLEGINAGDEVLLSDVSFGEENKGIGVT